MWLILSCCLCLYLCIAWIWRECKLYLCSPLFNMMHIKVAQLGYLYDSLATNQHCKKTHCLHGSHSSIAQLSWWYAFVEILREWIFLEQSPLYSCSAKNARVVNKDKALEITSGQSFLSVPSYFYFPLRFLCWINAIQKVYELISKHECPLLSIAWKLGCAIRDNYHATFHFNCVLQPSSTVIMLDG